MKYTEEEVRNWYLKYQEGLSQKAIGSLFKVDVLTINNYFDYYKLEHDWKSYHIQLSSEDLKKFNLGRSQYLDGGSINKAMVFAEIPETRRLGFTNYLKRTGVRIKTLSEVRKLITKENFFESIDSELKAYLLGFFAADGCLERRKDYDSYTLRIGVSIKDAHILKLFNKTLADDKISIGITSENMATFAITSKKLGEDLIALGFTKDKTKDWSKFPIISKDLIPHFIRGLFDGDGTVSVDRRHAGGRLSGLNRRVGFVSANEGILKEIADKTGIAFTIHKCEGKDCVIRGRLATFGIHHKCEIFNLDDIRKMHSYLYENATYFFKRKKDKFDLAILDIDEYDAQLQGNL